jgi:gluconolactonase
MALHDKDGLVVGGRDIAWVSLADGRHKTLLALDAIPGATGFNDLTTDRAGRIYVGSLAFKVFGGEAPRPGHLHVIETDGTMRTISDGVLLTNGLGFSPDGKLLYHSDARAPLVRVYDVEARRLGRPVAEIRLAWRGRRAGWAQGRGRWLGVGGRRAWRPGGGVRRRRHAPP